MWTCPECGREFKRKNQSHYCGKVPASVDEYIASQPPEARNHLEKLKDIIQHHIPGVRERIAWSMPVFETDKSRISMSACKKHVSLYLDSELIELFSQQQDKFNINKNTVYLPYDRELPVNILECILRQYYR